MVLSQHSYAEAAVLRSVNSQNSTALFVRRRGWMANKNGVDAQSSQHDGTPVARDSFAALARPYFLLVPSAEDYADRR